MSVLAPEDSLVSLVAALGELRVVCSSQRIIGVNAVANWLLDIRALARDVNPQLATPAEALLCTLTGRDLVAAEELQVVCAQIQAALMELYPQTLDLLGVGTFRSSEPKD